MARCLCLLLVILGLASRQCVAVKFAACEANVTEYLRSSTNSSNSSVALDFNATITTGPWPDPVYHGPIYGYHGAPEDRPLTLTLQGCKDACGTGSQLYSVDSAFAILTTWVLPVIALLSSLPYESHSAVKNMEALANWIGAPAAALTTTTWNILMISRCRKLSEQYSEHGDLIKDALYILSCINQYEYPRRPSSRWPSTDSNDDPRRDTALMRGVLFPLLDHKQLAQGRPLRQKLENITGHLAFQLRLQRRRGVFPLALSIMWFLLSFIVSIVLAFAQLGDNSTAHSLALGLSLSWLPILVVAAVVDRNPVATERCGILIERWLYNVEILFNEADLPHDISNELTQQMDASTERILPGGSQTPSRRSFQRDSAGKNGQYLRIPDTTTNNMNDRNSYEMDDVARAESIPESTISDRSEQSSLHALEPLKQWRRDSERTAFQIEDYVGQGRRLRYCAVADTVLDMFEQRKVNTTLPGIADAIEFKTRLPRRPWSWYVTWVVCLVLVTMGFATSFMVAFNTPTIGLGCRSLAYLIWYMLTLVSPIVILFFQEPPQVIRYMALAVNVFAALSLFTTMCLQMTGALNTCVCKCSIFGPSKYGGYMDFENGDFYRKAFFVETIWAVSTAFGLASCGSAIAWFYHRWSRDAALWKVQESHQPKIIDAVDLHWLT